MATASELVGRMRDLRWALLVMRVRRYRRRLLFSERLKFDANLRPYTKDRAMIAYPDAFYHFNAEDFRRARAALAALEPKP